MKRYTAEDLFSAKRPCLEYPRSRCKAIFGAGVTPRQIAELDIAISDRLWALSVLLVDSRVLARRIALDVIDMWSAPDVIRLNLSGEASQLGQPWGDMFYAGWTTVNTISSDSARDAAKKALFFHASRSVAWEVAACAAWAVSHATNKTVLPYWKKYLQWAVEAHEETDK